jgi:hypothetical protein
MQPNTHLQEGNTKVKFMLSLLQVTVPAPYQDHKKHSKKSSLFN